MSSRLRILIAAFLTLAFLVLLAVLLLLADDVYRAWENLRRGPDWLFWSVSGLFGVLSLLFGTLILRLLLPRRRRREPEPRPEPVRDEATMRSAVTTAEEQGVDVAEVREELQRLEEERTRPAAAVTVAFFGEISSGKSSLIKALVTEAEPAVDVRGGTTRTLTRYRWRHQDGGSLELLDMPGLNEAGAPIDDLAREAALRAHAVIYVCDGDLTRSQLEELRGLLGLDKPTILALNKADRFSAGDRERIRCRLSERAGPVREVVAVSAGGEREIVRILPNGDEETVTRPIPPRVDDLRAALTRVLGEDPTRLSGLRERAVFTLAGRKLDAAVARHRSRRAGEVVDGYTKRAVVGAMAAMSPGSDLIIQGFLGTRLIRDLATLYEVPVQRTDTELLLELVQKHVGHGGTLFLAVAGNALKAFPGVGTLAGGVVHAVAYGLIFNALGRAVARSLAAGGGLQPRHTAELFKETPRDELETMVRRLAGLAVAEVRRRRTDRE